MTDLAGLNDVDWKKLSHAYGDAKDTPKRLRVLLEGRSEEEVDKAGQKLWGSILHQGTIYTATIPAVGFLATIASRPEAPGNGWALALLTAFAQSVNAGWASNPHYLPKKTDLAAFENSCLEALASAALTVQPAIADPSADNRKQAALFYAELASLPQHIIEALRAQAAVEKDEAALVALFTTLGKNGGLTAAEKKRAGASGAASFAAAFAAVKAGPGVVQDEGTTSGSRVAPTGAADELVAKTHPDPDAATLVSLWAAQVAGFAEATEAESPLLELVGARRLEIAPLLSALADQAFEMSSSPDSLEGEPFVGRARVLADVIEGYLWLSRISRGALGAVVDGLLRIARGIEALDEADTAGPVQGLSIRNLLVFAMTEQVPPLRQASTLHDEVNHTPEEFLDAIIQVVTTSRRPRWTAAFAPGFASTNEPEPRDIHADVVSCFLQASDSRWLDLLRASFDEEIGDFVRCGTAQSWDALLGVITRWLKDQPLPPDQAQRLVDLAAELLPKTASGQVVPWLALLAELAPGVTRSLNTVVVDAALRAPRTAIYPPVKGEYETSVARFFSQLVLGWDELLPAAQAMLVQDAAAGRPRSAAWAELALLHFGSDSDRFAQRLGKLGLPEYSQEEFLRATSLNPPVAVLEQARLFLAQNEASFPGQEAQLVAASLIARADGLDAVWPKLLDIIDRQGDPLRNAITTTLALLADSAVDTVEYRDTLVTALRQIVEKGGKESWDGKDLTAPIWAAGGLVALGVPLPEITAKRVKALINSVTGYTNRNSVQALAPALDLVWYLPPKKRATLEGFIAELATRDQRCSASSEDMMTALDTTIRLALLAALEKGFAR